MIKPKSAFKAFVVPQSELEFHFVRSSGPGGQNVNKVNSKAMLRWNVPGSLILTEDLRARLLSKWSSRLTGDGDLILMSDRFRDQIRNREDCIRKLHELITQALDEPKPRKKSKPSFSSRLRAKSKKKRHSEKKQNRSFKF